jgi:hypothetical protein
MHVPDARRRLIADQNLGKADRDRAAVHGRIAHACRWRTHNIMLRA